MKPSNRMPTLLSVNAVAEYLGVCSKTVRRIIASGKLPTTRAGDQIRITESDLVAYLAHGKT